MEVGISNLPNQLHASAAHKGFQLTIMAVGESGSGKSTLLNALFAADLYTNTPYSRCGARLPQTFDVSRTEVSVVEEGVTVDVTVIDTPGFGTAVDNGASSDYLVGVINTGFEQFLDNEMKIVRDVSKTEDTRVHCCLYFLTANGHGLKELDVATMRLLHKRVNLVPIIAKADMQTVSEREEFKKIVTAELFAEKIDVFNFHDDVSDAVTPFAVSAARAVSNCDKSNTRVREYPWGVLDTENPEHSEFGALRRCLLRTNLHQLIDTTHRIHYDAFRASYFSSMSLTDTLKSQQTPMAQFESQQRQHANKIDKMAEEMELVFLKKVREQESKLKDLEFSLLGKHEDMKLELVEMQNRLHSEQENLKAAQETFQPAPPTSLPQKRLFGPVKK